MRPQLIQFSTVVAGKAHNPTILNPDFLALRNIVPEEWGWEVAETITIPPLARVQYKNGVTITVEQSKLQVSDLGTTDDPTKTKAVEIATAYVNTLPHVRYTAAGINFHSFIKHDSPESFLKDRFLKSGPWDTNAHPVNATGFRLIYPLEGGRISLSIDAGEAETVSDEGEQSHRERVSAILVNANFQRDCEDYPANEQVTEHLKHMPTDWSAYQTMLKDVLGTED